jgi:Flp pilus assembly protein TadG
MRKHPRIEFKRDGVLTTLTPLSEDYTAMIKKLNSDRGQTLVEFAFILVLLLLLILGIFEFSIIAYDKVMITRVSREGARAGVVFRADPSTFAYSPLTAAEIRTVVSNQVQTSGLVTFGTAFNPATDVTPTWSTDGGTTWTSTLPTTHGDGTLLRVVVTFRYSYLGLPWLGSIGGTALNLGSSTIMRME